MNLYIDHGLEIQVIQKCNLNCDHCFRGKSTNKRITKEVAEKILENVKYSRCIMFSGGEVALAYNEIKMIIDIIKEKNIKIDYYQIITNGTIYNKKLLDLLKDNFESGEIFLSCDYFHDKSIKEKYKSNLKLILRNLRKIVNDPHFKGINVLPKYIINSGNAKKLRDIYKVSDSAMGFISYPHTINGEHCLKVGPYVSFDVFGNLVDSSSTYELNDNNHYGNIFKDNLFDLILNNSIHICNDSNTFLEKLQIRNDEFWGIDEEVPSGFIKENYVIRNKKLIKEDMKIVNNIRNRKYYNEEKMLVFKKGVL